MVRWITENIGTASRLNIAEDKQYGIVDVRDLVDKKGNSPENILKKIDEALKFLNGNKKVVICCDYGISRSNSIAAGVISKQIDCGFNEAIKLVVEKTGEDSIQLDMINSVRKAVEGFSERFNNATKKILVTGGSGFIGRSLIPELKKENDVIATSSKKNDLLKGLIDLDLIVKEENVKTIIHLASPRKYSITKSMGESIVMLKNVLDLCMENKLKLIYLSGWVVYSGYKSERMVVSESVPLFPKGTYAETKALCECLIKDYIKSNNLNADIIRVSPVYGSEGDKPKFIHAFFEKAQKNENIITHKYYNGFPALDLLHISDLVSLLSQIVKRKNDERIELNVGYGECFTTNAIAHKIKNICNSKSNISFQKIDDYTSNIVMDTSKVKKQLGWRPKVKLDDGLKEIQKKYLRRKNENGQY